MLQSSVRCLLLALASILMLSGGALAQTQTARVALPVNLQGARAYSAIGTSFDWPNFTGDPFDYISHDVRVRVAVPGGAIVSLPAFFDGGTAWRARHTPKVPGVYKIVGVYQNGQKLNLSAQPQRFNVGKASALGGAWVRVDAKNARRFSLADGQRFYPFGMNQA